jgi:hypothetical protein
MTIKEKKQKILEKILSRLKLIDPKDVGKNRDRYINMFAKMSDAKFVKYMEAIRAQKTVIYIYLPNGTDRLTAAELAANAEKMGVKIFHRIKLWDEHNERFHLTNEEHMVLRTPVRRMEQFLDKGLSVSEGDKYDASTGQVAWESRSAKITPPEIQALYAKNQLNTLKELVGIRGGNVNAWNGEMKRMLEEEGSVSLDNIDSTSRTRTAMVTKALLESMHIENNLVEA